jgi:hypothetical protein
MVLKTILQRSLKTNHLMVLKTVLKMSGRMNLKMMGLNPRPPVTPIPLLMDLTPPMTLLHPPPFSSRFCSLSFSFACRKLDPFNKVLHRTQAPWAQAAYSIARSFIVVALLGRGCLY